VVFALDNDGKDMKSEKLIEASAKRLIAQGKDVSFMLPRALKAAKQDYNDILKQVGKEAIKQDFSQSFSIEEGSLNTENLKSTFTIYHQNRVNHEQVLHNIMAKERDNSHSLSSISDKMIADYSMKLNQERHSIERQNSDTYRNLTTAKEEKVPATLSGKYKEFEHEI
jgi:hypothetical protein